MNPKEDPIARIPEPFSEPQTIPAGWNVSALDMEEREKNAHHGKKDKSLLPPNPPSLIPNDDASNAL